MSASAVKRKSYPGSHGLVLNPTGEQCAHSVG